MITLNTLQRKTWQAILADDAHPWNALAEQTIKRDAEIKKIKAMFRKLKSR